MRPSLAVRCGALLLCCLLCHRPAIAADPVRVSPPPRPRGDEPLTGGVPIPEVALLAQVSVGNLAMVMLRSAMDARLDRPTIPAGFFGAWDVRLSELAYRGAAPLHGKLPEHLGTLIMPALFTLFYVSDAAVYWRSGRSWTDRLTGGHSAPGAPVRLLFGALETMSYSLFVQQVFHSVLRRDRPALVLGRREIADSPFGQHQSFYSGHASLAFAIAAYSSLHVGDALGGRLRRLHPVPRALLARVVPSLLLYGVAGYVAYGRLHDQQHFFSDTLIGASIGAAIGNAVYFWHTRGPHARR